MFKTCYFGSKPSRTANRLPVPWLDVVDIIEVQNCHLRCLGCSFCPIKAVSLLNWLCTDSVFFCTLRDINRWLLWIFFASDRLEMGSIAISRWRLWVNIYIIWYVFRFTRATTHFLSTKVDGDVVLCVRKPNFPKETPSLSFQSIFTIPRTPKDFPHSVNAVFRAVTHSYISITTTCWKFRQSNILNPGLDSRLNPGLFILITKFFFPEIKEFKLS